MTVCGFDNPINLVGDGFEIVLAVVVRSGHPRWNVQPCVVSVIKRRFCTGLQEQAMRNKVQSVFRFEVLKIRSIRERTGGQHMAHISVPNFTPENVVDILGGTA